MSDFLKWHSKIDILQEVHLNNCLLFKNFTGMSAGDFELLLRIIVPKVSKQDTNMRESIPSSTRLVVTLRFLATGDSYHSLIYTFKISVATVSHIIPEVSSVLIQVLEEYLKVNMLKVCFYSSIVI
jgi:hypothetical protein